MPPRGSSSSSKKKKKAAGKGGKSAKWSDNDASDSDEIDIGVLAASSRTQATAAASDDDSDNDSDERVAVPVKKGSKDGNGKTPTPLVAASKKKATQSPSSTATTPSKSAPLAVASSPAVPVPTPTSSATRQPTTPTAGELTAEAIALNIMYEDDDILVIVKPAGMVVHPAPDSNSHYTGTLVNALLYHCGPTKLASSHDTTKVRPGIVHRLDRDTSGLMIVAKTDVAYKSLHAQFKTHSVMRRYYALVHGNPKISGCYMDTWNGRHPVHRQRRAVLADIRSTPCTDSKYVVGIAATPLPIIGTTYSVPVSQLPIIRPSYARAPTDAKAPHISAKRSITTWGLVERFELRRKPVTIWTRPKGVRYDVNDTTSATATAAPSTSTSSSGGEKKLAKKKATKHASDEDSDTRATTTNDNDSDDDDDDTPAVPVKRATSAAARKKNKKKAKKQARRSAHNDDDGSDDNDDDELAHHTKQLSIDDDKDDNNDDDDDSQATRGGQHSDQCVPFAVVEAQLDTGRTHQVRVHLSHMRHPLLNDHDYGPRKTFPGRTDRWPTSRALQAVLASGSNDASRSNDIATGQLLHAHYFEFDHPVTNKRMTFTAPLPPAFARVVLWLRENASVK